MANSEPHSMPQMHEVFAGEARRMARDVRADDGGLRLILEVLLRIEHQLLLLSRATLQVSGVSGENEIRAYQGFAVAPGVGSPAQAAQGSE